MQSLQARIRELEADNASLATAAEQAAALAEEYAADAANYRAANNSSQTALVNELTDATRRKDRRIQRLTNMLDAEKKRTEDLQRRLEELEEIRQVGVEESTIRDPVKTVRQRPAPVSAASVPSTCRLPVKVLSALETMFPPDVRGVFAAFRVFFFAESVQVQTSRIALVQDTGKADDGFVQLAKVVEELTRRAVAWCFETPMSMAERGVMLDQCMSNLDERMEALSREVSEGEPERWTLEYARMKQDIVVMAVEVVKSVVPASWSRMQDTDSMDFEEICRQQAREMKTIMTNEERETQTKIVDDLKSKLNAARLMLEQRTKELEDIRVRSRVFETKLEGSRKDKDMITQLQSAVKSLETELAEARAAAEHSTTAVEKVSEEENTETPRKGDNEKDLLSLVKHITAREQVERRSEAHRLRRMLVQSQLADLQTSTPLSRDVEAQFQEIMRVRNAVTTALNDARTAASNARVVRLDPQTLKPKIEGATMSRKTLFQSLSVLEKPTRPTHHQQDLKRFAEKREAKLRCEPNQVYKLMSLWREAV